MFGSINKAILNNLLPATRLSVLNHVATTYGITREEANKKLIDREASHILDYLRGPIRRSICLIIKTKL